jgi:hypothetical protein
MGTALAIRRNYTPDDLRRLARQAGCGWVAPIASSVDYLQRWISRSGSIAGRDWIADRP